MKRNHVLSLPLEASTARPLPIVRQGPRAVESIAIHQARFLPDARAADLNVPREIPEAESRTSPLIALGQCSVQHAAHDSQWSRQQTIAPASHVAAPDIFAKDH